MSSPRSVAECRLRLRTLPHIAPTQHSLVASRNGTLATPPRGCRWFRVGLWQTTSHSRLSELGFCVSLQSDPSPAGNQEPLASRPACHRSELADPSSLRGCSAAPHVPRSSPSGAGSQSSLLSVSPEGMEAGLRLPNSIPAGGHHQHDSLGIKKWLILPGTVVELKTPGKAQRERCWRLHDHP